MTDRYLIDTVTLSKMTFAQRASAFVRSSCAIPTPVLYEARELNDSAALAHLEYVTSIEVLRHVSTVVNSIADGDKLLDLYHNEGNGDVFLLAVALVEGESAANQLFADRWVIATDDHGLTDKAAELGVATCSSAQFIALLA